ncbi:MAG TPA: hypothetical protein VMN36_12830 [Verrucomicrobiales bacterium]|nr:hypothetical protein [Verrucomicrobiales bacterium]
MRRRGFLFVGMALTARAGGQVPEGWRQEWPLGYDGSRLALEIREAEPYAQWRRYLAGSCEVLSDRALERTELEPLMTAFASVNPAVRRIPIGLTGERRSASRLRARLFSDGEAYLAAGGAPGTVGVYNGRQDETVMLSSALFGEEKGRKRDDGDRFDVFVHEVTHHVLRGWRGRLPAWFSEGFSEFMAVAHFRPGLFDFGRTEVQIPRHIGRFLLPTGGLFDLPPLAEVTRLSSADWMRANHPDEADNYAKYAAALLLLEWWLRRKPGGTAEVRQYLTELRGLRRGGPHVAEPWGDHDDLGAIQPRLVAFWRRNGLRIRFSSA